MKEEKWGTIQEAVEFYGVSLKTVHTYRRQGRIKSKRNDYKNRIAYAYLLDEGLRKSIELAKVFDTRWVK